MLRDTVSQSPAPVDACDVRPAPFAGLLRQSGCTAELTRALAGLLRSAGWKVELVQPERLSSFPWDPWDVIVIPAARVTEETLIVAAQAARATTTRTALVSPDRDPLHIADILRSGVDDYIVTPFLPEECLARLESLAVHARAIRERQPTATGEPIRHSLRNHPHHTSRLRFDPATRTIRDGAARVVLSTREWDVLAALLAAGEQLTTAAQLATAVWGAPDGEAQVISTISRLRRKLAEAPVRTLDVITIRGGGYRVLSEI
jgi:DNA-binding response OmpR family regulator